MIRTPLGLSLCLLGACAVSPRQPGDVYSCTIPGDCPGSVPFCCGGICEVGGCATCGGLNTACLANADCCAPAECAPLADGGYGNCCLPGGAACTSGTECCNATNSVVGGRCDYGAGTPCKLDGGECGATLTCRAVLADIGVCQ